MKKIIFALIVIALLFSFELKAETSPYHSLRYASTARTAGLAGAVVAIPNDAGTISINPASISTVSEKRFSASFIKHILDINSGNVAFIKEFEETGTFAGFVSYTSYGSFTRVDKDGNQTGSFNSSDLNLSVCYSNELDSNFYYGVTAKYIYMNIDKYNSSAIALDAGLLYLIPNIRTNVGLSILNVGTQLSTFDGTKDELPLDIRLGVSHLLRGLPLLINFSLHHLADETDNFFDKFANFSIGGELYLGKYVQLRLGYDNHIRRYSAPSNEKKLAGLSGGLGLKLDDFNLDYSMSQVGVAATLHRFSLYLDL